jgi:hypothetical protein
MMQIQDYIHAYDCDYSTAVMFKEMDKKEEFRTRYEAALKRDEYRRQNPDPSLIDIIKSWFN